MPAANLEKAALQQYGQLRSQAVSRNSLLPPEDEQAKRVQSHRPDLLPHTHKWNPRAKDWSWEVILVKTPTVNALCMPGGKIAVFTGILDALKLTDDELAMVLGHEMAHALREHARARAAKVTLTNVGTLAIGLVIGGNVGELARQGGGLLNLKFNRDDEQRRRPHRHGDRRACRLRPGGRHHAVGEDGPGRAQCAPRPGCRRIPRRRTACGACGRRSRTSPGSTPRPRRTVRP